MPGYMEIIIILVILGMMAIPAVVVLIVVLKNANSRQSPGSHVSPMPVSSPDESPMAFPEQTAREDDKADRFGDPSATGEG